MKWLLITNIGNPGDEAVRIGIEKIIKAVDAEAKFHIVRRDPKGNSTGIYAPLPKHDVAVLCGMPVVWSHWHKGEENGIKSNTTTHGAWGPLKKIAASGKLIIAGYGLYLTYGKTRRDIKMLNHTEVFPIINESLFAPALTVYSRSPLGTKCFGHSHSPCPSIFAGMDMQDRPKDLKLFNMMFGGAHYPTLDAGRALTMWREWPLIGKQCRELGYKAIAHHPVEAEMAMEHCGFKEDECIVFDWTMDSFLDIYSRCSHYVGNRIHGAIMARSFGARVMCCGYDTRLDAVKLVGGLTCLPEKLKDGEGMARFEKATFEPIDLEGEFSEQIERFKLALSRLNTPDKDKKNLKDS